MAKETPSSKEKAKVKRVKLHEKHVQVYRGFFDFIREQGVVGLAVGLAIGAQTNTTVKSIVEGLINPIVDFILGSSTELADRQWYLVGHDTDTIDFLFTLGDRQLVFGWGQVVSSLIQLIAVAAVIYFVVRGIGLDRLDKKKS